MASNSSKAPSPYNIICGFHSASTATPFPYFLLAKNIDGVYSADPKKDPSAVKYDTITYDDMLAQHLQVMDSTATSLSMDNKIPVVLFALKDPENILRVVMGEKIGTIVKEEP